MAPPPSPFDELDPSLLEPSLSTQRNTEPLFSARAGFLTAFAGGVYAAVIFGLINSVRMRRAKQDAWLYVIAAILWTVAISWIAREAANPAAPGWLTFFGDAGRTTRHAGRAFALLLFGASYLRQRPMYDAQALSGQASPNPWPLGIGSVVAAAVVTLLVLFLSTGAAP